MGKSEWGVLVRSLEDARAVLDAVSLHNAKAREQAAMTDEELSAVSEEVGEDLECYAAIRFRGRVWLCVGNGGGAKLTSAFLHARLADKTILWPFAKPEGWNECEAYVWQASSRGAAAGRAGDAGLVGALRVAGVPDTFEGFAEGFVEEDADLQPTPPPSRDVRDDFADMIASMFPGRQILRESRIARG